MIERLFVYVTLALPGTILVALVVHSALNAGWHGLIGVSACLCIYFRIKNLLVVMITGVVTVFFLRLIC